MKASIRKFLLINLLLAITVTTTLTAIGNYYLDQKDIQEHLDTLMAVSGLSYEALLGNDLHERHLMGIQTALETIPKQLRIYYPRTLPHTLAPHDYLNKFNFQVWSAQGVLLLHSPVAPNVSFGTVNNGFTNVIKNDQKWRIFSTNNLQTGARVILAERDDTRNELGKRIAQDDLYIMLLTFPLSGLLIWIIIGRGLDSLDRVAKEVANRAPTHLEPVNLQSVPQEIKPVIDELNNLFKRLQNGFEREKRFTADAAHELRTPLAAIKAQAQVALNSQDIHEKNAALQKLIASVNRSTHIVQQLLTMSKLVPEIPGNHDGFDQVDLARVTRDILAMLAHAAIEKTVELEFKQETTSPFVNGNPTILGILIRNLVDNAIRYTKDQGVVLVRVYKDNNHVVLEVSDNGPGIPKELHSRVFERFFRVLGNKSTGSGLGLAIVQQICTLHHAHVELSAPTTGTGLIVKVHFPTSPI